MEDAAEQMEDVLRAEEEGERGLREVRWFVPEGFQVAAEPAQLNEVLIGCSVCMRWEKFGWQLGKITAVITNATVSFVLQEPLL